MFQVGMREKGKCLFSMIGCDAEEVVAVTKVGEQPMKACKRHLWEILANGQKKEKKPQGQGDPKADKK